MAAISIERRARVERLKDRIRRSEYRVDPAAVAGALLDRLALAPSQPACSKPASPRSRPA